MTWRSTYTHDPMTGQRVEQYAQEVQPLAPDQGNHVRSGYRHYRSSLQVGTSADNLHIVNEYGRPVMPYEHWRFPYRPYGTPYSSWGPPVPNVLGNFGNGFGFGFGGGFGGAGFPLVPPFQNAPYYDGFYPSAPPLDTQSDPSFFYRPNP